jgi:outer membrane receptor protein involved in Fe transport
LVAPASAGSRFRLKPGLPARTAIALILAAPALLAQTVTLAPQFVTATRAPQSPDQVAHSTTLLDASALHAAPTATLDGALRTLPAFSLFRRSDSLSANPTAQGVSLRGLGPSGASRSLVLLDGVPLNDPFGGWVAWTKVPRDGLERVELVPGGGATAWGNAALGGVVQLITTPPRASMRFVGLPAANGEPVQLWASGSSGPKWPGTPGWEASSTGQAEVTAGDFGTRSAEFIVTEPIGHGLGQVLGRDFSTAGFSLVAPERRGPIDIAAWSRHRWLGARWSQSLAADLDLMATARTFEEFRGNGTPYQHNGSREHFVSLALTGRTKSDLRWNATAYAQDQSFASTFSSVNAARTAETPASDQFAVPATALGGAWTARWTDDRGGQIVAGLDLRTVRGETRENFIFVSGAFTRRRVAGGRQSFGGVFVMRELPLPEHVRLTLGGRLDEWNNLDGHRRETDRATGAVLRDDHYDDRNGIGFSPNVGLVWRPNHPWRVRANAQQAFRVPTLNELYRPFRQGTTVVETNPALRPERNTSAEVGVEWNGRGAVQPNRDPRTGRPGLGFSPFLTFGATAFWNELRDAVGNVTLARGPGTFPIFGTLAAGGTGRQRLNVDRIRVQGLELSATWHASETLSLTATALFNDPEVRRATVAPALVGKQVAQVPRHSASFGATWRAPGGITLTPRVRWIGRQFEDDENTLILGEAVVVDFGASRALTKHLELFLSVENLGNARLETGRSADGVVNLGTPRLALGGIRGNW